MPSSTLALKVDVDTLVGTREGVPRLRAILDRRGVKASFYLSLGPDNSGKAVWRAFTRPGFIDKMIRTKAPSAYGLRTLVYGTLWPAPVISTELGPLITDLAASDHEVGLHAWDHVWWHDCLWKASPDRIRDEIKMALFAFEAETGRRPQGFAAPAWRINVPAAAALSESGFTYLSTTRGRGPYRPLFYGRNLGLLELPTTLPTADEVLGRGGITPDNLDEFLLRMIDHPGFGTC